MEITPIRRRLETGDTGYAGWHEIYGQERAVGFLEDVLERGEVPHALVFTGPKGVGKHSTALMFAAALFCAERNPDSCPSCRKVSRGVHPDLHLVEAEGSFILIDQMRDLDRELAVKPQESWCKVVIVDDADTMNREAANAFLKTLEEPPPDTFVILVTESTDILLPTVASRCREVRFSPLGKRDIERFLREREAMDEATAEKYARLSGGIFGRALMWARNPDLAAHWNSGVELAVSLRRSSLLDVLERVAELRKHMDASAAGGEDDELLIYLKAMDKRSGDRLRKRWEKKEKREVARMRRQAALDLFDGMSSFYRDIMLLNFSEEAGEAVAAAPVLNLEWRGSLESEALHMGTDEAMRRMAALRKARKALEANVDIGLLLDSLVLELKGFKG